MVKFDEVRTGGNMMPTATLAVGTTEGKISGKRHLKVKGDGDDCWKKGETKKNGEQVLYLIHTSSAKEVAYMIAIILEMEGIS